MPRRQRLWRKLASVWRKLLSVNFTTTSLLLSFVDDIHITLQFTFLLTHLAGHVAIYHTRKRHLYHIFLVTISKYVLFGLLLVIHLTSMLWCILPLLCTLTQVHAYVCLLFQIHELQQVIRAEHDVQHPLIVNAPWSITQYWGEKWQVMFNCSCLQKDIAHIWMHDLYWHQYNVWFCFEKVRLLAHFNTNAVPRCTMTSWWHLLHIFLWYHLRYLEYLAFIYWRTFFIDHLLYKWFYKESKWWFPYKLWQP